MEQERTHSVTLTDDRLAQRQYEQAVNKDIASLEKETGLSLSRNIKDGEQGIYRGIVEVAGRRYGVMEQENKSGKLIAAEHLESRQKGNGIVVEKQTDYKEHARFKGFQPKVREQERSMSRGFDIGGL